MALLPSLPEQSTLFDYFRRYPKGIASLLLFSEALLRGPGELSEGERELVAAYVSGLNACDFCHGAHVHFAEALGIEPELVAACLDDLESAPVSRELRALLAYARKLNTLPSRMVSADVQEVLEAGCSEAALSEAIQICALFNMMNRIVEGAGVSFSPPSEGKPQAISYAAFAERLSGTG